jgi:ABC-type dipeptide/oligopeptide/nickel transport system permease component
VAAVATLFVAITINFILFRAAPGDAVTNIAKVPNASPKVLRTLREQFGLDKSKWEQYLDYLKQLAHGNLGRSFVDSRTVKDHLVEGAVNTVPMVLIGMLVAIALGIAFGVFSAWRRNTFLDHGTTLSALALYSMPTQFVGIVLIILTAGFLPTGGMEDPFLKYTNPGFLPHVLDVAKHMVLPALTLGVGIYGQFVVITRSAMLETLGEDYILTARAKGVSSWRIITRHAARNALLPVWTIVALSLGTVVGGAVLVEIVFSWPGLGLATYTAVQNLDYPVLQGIFLVLTASVIVANFLVDLLYLRLDPRVVE